MKTSERFDQATSKLLKAYFNNTLNKNSLSHCAVGEICNNSNQWAHVFCSKIMKGFGSEPDKYMFQYCDENAYLHYCPEAKRVIDATGYTWKQLAKVEETFVRACLAGEVFDALMQVIDLLSEFDNLEVPAETKDCFVSIKDTRKQLGTESTMSPFNYLPLFTLGECFLTADPFDIETVQEIPCSLRQ